MAQWLVCSLLVASVYMADCVLGLGEKTLFLFPPGVMVKALTCLWRCWGHCQVGVGAEAAQLLFGELVAYLNYASSEALVKWLYLLSKDLCTTCYKSVDVHISAFPSRKQDHRGIECHCGRLVNRWNTGVVSFCYFTPSFCYFTSQSYYFL